LLGNFTFNLSPRYRKRSPKSSMIYRVATKQLVAPEPRQEVESIHQATTENKKQTRRFEELAVDG